jgi:hypothetical protein
MRPALPGLLFLLLPGLTAAQTPSPKPAPRRPAPKATAKPKPAPAATPTPVPIADQLLDTVRNASFPDAEQELKRKMVLAVVGLHRGKPEGQALLDEVEKGILALPKNPPDRPDSINFGRMILWWNWITAAQRTAPERAIASLKPFADAANPRYSSSVIESVAQRADCTQPGQKASLDKTAEGMFDFAKKLVDTSDAGRASGWAAPALTSVAVVDLRCGSGQRVAAAAQVVENLVKKVKKERSRLECELLEARAWSRMPALDRALAAFREDQALEFDDHLDLCETERLAFAADVMRHFPPPEASRPALTAFVDAAVADLKPAVPESAPSDKGAKKPKGPLPPKGASFYDVSSAASRLAQLAPFAPQAASSGAQRLYDIWLAQWTPSVSGGERTLRNLAQLGATMAKSGAKPDWLCGLPSAMPKSELKPEGQPALARERLLAAAEISAACPVESEAALKLAKPAEDVNLASWLVVRTALVDRPRAEAMASNFWPQIPADKRYEFASSVVERLVGVPEE